VVRGDVYLSYFRQITHTGRLRDRLSWCPMILCNLLLLSTLGLAARYASAALECLQTFFKSAWWCGRVVVVGKLVGVYSPRL
jgi:hypothetical protein